MEPNQTSSSSKLKRKPLSDCTNTRHNHHSSKLISKTISKIPKIPSNFNPITNASNPNKRKKENPNFNSNNDVVAVSKSSVKSRTSTGSNNSDSVPSQPPTPLLCVGDIVRRRPGSSAALTQRQDEQIRNEKGKSVGATPSGQTSYLASQAAHMSSFAVSAIGGHANRLPTAENCEVDEQKRKDKGKMVEETPIIHISPPLTSNTLQTSSSAASGTYVFPRPSAVHSHQQDEKSNTVNRRTVQETPNVEAYGNIVSRNYGPSPTLTLRHNAQTGSDKGTSVRAPTIVQTSTYLTSRATDNDHVCRPPAIENPDVDEQRRKDKGKMVVETPIIHISSPFTSQTLQTSASVASGSCYLPRASSAHSHEQDEHLTQVKKDNIRIGQEKPNVEAFGPVTPSPLVSSSASGTDGQEKTGLIANNLRRTSQRKKLAVGSISLPFSCPPTKRTKKKGVELDDGGGDGHSGSHTDPLPLHKKKRARNKKEDAMHAMPQDEVEKLKAYYADIDAFQLSEEEASETELE